MYEIWDRSSGNRLGEFYTEGEALETVRVIAEDDPGGMDALVLILAKEEGGVQEVASGSDLGELVRRRRRAAAL
jgi:hypothetical protein